MIKRAASRGVLCTLLFFAAAQGDDTIQGRAVTVSTLPIANVRVAMLQRSMSDTTAADGRFMFIIPSTAVRLLDNASPEFFFRNNRIEISLRDRQTVSITVFSISGRKTAVVFSGTLTKGKHGFLLDERNLGTAAGLYILRIATDESLITAKITMTGGMIFADAGITTVTRTSRTTGLAVFPLAVDSIALSKYGYVPKKVPLASFATQNLGDIVLDTLFWGAKTMTFNIRGPADPSPNSWAERRSRVITVLNNYGPAFIGFQELIASYIPDIISGCPGYGYYGVGRDAGGGGESCRIFYLTSDWRIDSSNAGTFWLSLTPNVPGSTSWGTGSTRICTHARFVNKTTGVGFYVFNTHLDNASELARTNGIHMIADSIAARPHTEDPFVLTGDFNSNESSAVVVYLKQGAANPVLMTDSYRILYPSATGVGTFHGFTGQGGSDKIDYIMSKKDGYKVTAAEIIKYNVSNLYPSDHFPVYAEVSFPYPNMATMEQP